MLFCCKSDDGNSYDFSFIVEATEETRKSDSVKAGARIQISCLLYMVYFVLPKPR